MFLDVQTVDDQCKKVSLTLAERGSIYAKAGRMDQPGGDSGYQHRLAHHLQPRCWVQQRSMLSVICTKPCSHMIILHSSSASNCTEKEY